MKNTDLVGSIMSKNVAIVPDSYTVAEAIHDLRTKSESWDSLQYLYITNTQAVLVGVMSLHQLFRESDDQLIMSFAEKKLVTTHPNTDQEKAALTALHAGIREIPVVDDSGCIIGVLTGDSLMTILDQEAVENILKFAGISGDEDDISKAQYPSLRSSLTARLPWLFIGLIGGFGTAFIGQIFEEVLQQTILLALFIPLMVYMAGSTGAQMQVFIIRDLAIQKNFRLVPYFLSQASIVVALATVLSATLGSISLILYGSPSVSLVLTLALFVSIASSIFSGIIVPYIFFKLKQDPANASGPIGTIIQDISTIFIYFLIAQAIL